MDKCLVDIVISSRIPNLWSSKDDYDSYKRFIKGRNVEVENSFLVYSPEHRNLMAFISDTGRRARKKTDLHSFADLTAEYLQKRFVQTGTVLKWAPSSLEELEIVSGDIEVIDKKLIEIPPPYIILTAPDVESFTEKLVGKLGYKTRIIHDS